MKTLSFLNFLSELFQLIFELGTLTRQYLVPAVVYLYVVFDYYLKPALSIPYYYVNVRRERLAMTT